MTTIAYRAGVMACDSLWSFMGGVNTLSTKLSRLKSGALLGCSGDNDSRDIVDMLAGVKNARGLPKFRELDVLRINFSGLLVLPNGTIFQIATTMVDPQHRDADFDEDLGAWEIEADFAAVGSGSDAALGAMACGADARKAVRIACKYDLHSRPPVHILSLGTKLKPAR